MPTKKESTDIPQPVSNDKAIDIHIAHKREAFDVMRANQDAEIAHAQDAIGVLKTILQTTIIIFGGLIGSFITLSTKVNPSSYLICSGIISLLIICIVLHFTRATRKKIDQSNSKYVIYREEYAHERVILGIAPFEFDIDAYNKAHKKSPYIPGGGYKFTKRILNSFTWIVVITALIGTGIVWLAIKEKNNSIEIKNQQKKQDQTEAPKPADTICC